MSKQIRCPNPECDAPITVTNDRPEIMCHKCGVTIDLKGIQCSTCKNTFDPDEHGNCLACEAIGRVYLGNR